MTKEQLLRRKRAVNAALGSVRAEGLEPSKETLKRLQRFADGEITAQELRDETLVDAKKTS